MFCMAAPASCTSCVPAPTFSTLVEISALISLAASALRCARLRTSPATTAKPRPCSPARAASTAALSARMLVWKAMPSMVPMMSAMRRELVWMSSMVFTTCATRLPPCEATSAADEASVLAVRAASADCCTVAVNCSMDEAVCCRLAAVCSVREERSCVPPAIWSLALAISSPASWIWPITVARACCMSASARSSWPVSSLPVLITVAVRSPRAMVPATATESPSGRVMLRVMTTASTMPRPQVIAPSAISQ